MNNYPPTKLNDDPNDHNDNISGIDGSMSNN